VGVNPSHSTAVIAATHALVVHNEINGLFETASMGELQGILGFETRPLVSADFVNDQRSGIVDALSTMVIDSRMVKVLIWYDNEYGYAFRMAELAAKVAQSLGTHP
jgi:glyceraldehyde 3-phosphate dehydrogenase